MRSSVSKATTILCFGDSWTHGNAYALQEQLHINGHSNVRVVNKDRWGSTAEHFASNPTDLPNAVSKCDADYVLLSMGGNDFKNIYWRKKQYVTPWTAVSGIEKNIKTVLDALFEKHPEVKVVTYGYDFPGSVDGLLDGSLWGGDKDASSTAKFLIWMYNNLGVRFINYSAMQLGSSFERLSKEYQKKGFSFTYVPLWGSLQSAAIGKETFSYSLGKPSPHIYMQDPIHANRDGYNVLLSNLYKAYFGKLLTVQA